MHFLQHSTFIHSSAIHIYALVVPCWPLRFGMENVESQWTKARPVALSPPFLYTKELRTSLQVCPQRLWQGRRRNTCELSSISLLKQNTKIAPQMPHCQCLLLFLFLLPQLANNGCPATPQPPFAPSQGFHPRVGQEAWTSCCPRQGSLIVPKMDPFFFYKIY